MALVLEDGTGLPTANTYLLVATADAYHSELCNEGWGGAVTKKEAALIRATRWMDEHYEFLGDRKVLGSGSSTGLPQALKWPRQGVVHPDGYCVDQDALPVEVIRATAEVALAVLEFGGQLDPAVEPGGTLTEELEKVGRTWVQTKYEAGGIDGPAKIPAALTIIRPLLSLGTQDRLNRA